MESYMEPIRQYIEAHREDMIRFWEKLVNMQGSSREKEKVNRVMDFLKESFEAEGLACRLEDSQGNANVLIVVDGPDRPGRPVILSGHADTVFPEGSYPEDPFRIEDGKAYGPGVIDMKGGITIMLYAVKALHYLGYGERPVKIILVGDEEIGHTGSISSRILMEEAKGGLCAFNMEIGRPDNCLTTGRKGGVDCHVTVHGVGGHVGNDFLKGRNAIAEMAYKIPLLQNLTRYEEGVVVSVDVIHGGTVSNVVPDLCEAELDIRYNRVSDMDPICQKVREVCSRTFIEGTRTEVEFLSPMPAFEETEANHRLLDYVNGVLTKNGFPPFGSIFVGGNSDASFLAAAGVPTVCSFGVVGTGAHTKEECAVVDSLFERTKMVTAAIMEINDYEANWRK
ncbi:M20 family metallopeptidase [Lacrimispora sp. 210928-DFI.3.58]|uniref:M20 family metallopeptidase n=1 Tax=Lacrimispora sp. 210928-DFI.3.58 TaxID=2883214 RepID=UPI001D07DC50|nr:M20 family metallopeptidase [Lacrimispora sp. 210928-DFI.3.58]MCB7320420.1 M20 family metallopeptidase [Lacrimispora sp. 210928-DFI.3.58]